MRVCGGRRSFEAIAPACMVECWDQLTWILSLFGANPPQSDPWGIDPTGVRTKAGYWG